MRGKRHSLSNQLMGIQTPKKTVHRLDFQKVILQQQQVIKLLQKQITYLRQYLFYVADFDEVKSISSSKITSDKKEPEQDQNTSLQGNDSKNQSTGSADPATKKITGLKGLIQQIMKTIDAKTPQQIIGKLKVIYQKANRKIQPVFIERIKQKEVPVTMEVVKEVVKEVEKEVIVEKIVEKIVEVPVFKEKIVEKYLSPDQSFDSPKNSPRNDLYMKKKGEYFESKNLNQTTRQKYKEKDNSQQFYETSDRRYDNSPRWENANSPRWDNHNSPKWDKWGKKKRYGQKKY